MASKKAKAGAEIKGLDKQIGLFNHLEDKGARAVARAGVRAGSGEIRKATKRETPKDTGALHKSIKNKVVTNRNASKITGMIGADVNYVGPDGNRPIRYFHLVNNGHINRDGSFTPGVNMLEKGFSAGAAPAKAKSEAKIKTQIAKEVAKGKKKRNKTILKQITK